MKLKGKRLKIVTNKLKVYYKARKFFLSFFYLFIFGEGEEGLEDEHILPLVLQETILLNLQEGLMA